MPKEKRRGARGVAVAMWRSLDEVHEMHEAARAVCDRCFVAIEVSNVLLLFGCGVVAIEFSSRKYSKRRSDIAYKCD